MRLLRRALGAAGRLVCLVAMLPLPWPWRAAWYALLGRLVAKGMDLVPGAFAMMADQGAQYEMGKSDRDQVVSILCLKRVVHELDRRAVEPGRVAEAYLALQADGIPTSEIPKRLACRLLGAATWKKLSRQIGGEL